MKRLLLPMIVITASSCGVGEKPASDNDRLWVERASDACPALERTVTRAMKDGVISNDEADAVAAAARIIVANPVKGQICLVPSTSRPSSHIDADPNFGLISLAGS
jgi:hypothetical protein